MNWIVNEWITEKWSFGFVWSIVDEEVVNNELLVDE